MRLRSLRRKRTARTVLLVVALASIGGAAWAYRTVQLMAEAPHRRLALDAFYPEMPPDRRHFYINLPLDHAQPSGPQYRGFYILSPRFQPGGSVVFAFTDGQMELVGTRPDTDFFDTQLPGLSYVLIGHRGHQPLLFPEVYPGGRVDPERAARLYASSQRVEDIDWVRRDMAVRGLLPRDERIMIFGASGAGVLAQEYLDRHGEHVSRVMLASTGAPDLSAARGETYTRPFADFDADCAARFARLTQGGGPGAERLAFLLYQLGRQGSAGRAEQRRVLDALLAHNPLPYAWRLLRPSLNLSLVRAVLRFPASDAAKVRMVELASHDLRRLPPAQLSTSLLYPWMASLLRDDETTRRVTPLRPLNRSGFKGEVLVVTGADDIVFSPAIGRAIASAYPDGQFVLVRAGHRLELDDGYHTALRRSFFTAGLHAPQTQQLLAAAPTR